MVIVADVPEVDVPKEEFHITDDRSADWYLRQIAALDAEAALIAAQAEAAIGRLKSDKERLERIFQGELEEYVRQRVQADKSGRKSVVLLHGTCGFRKVPASVKVSDPHAALMHVLRENKGEEMTRRELVVSEYRKWAQEELQATGEQLPGIDITPEHESFSVKFGKGAKGDE